jgi:hypothetical protein
VKVPLVWPWKGQSLPEIIRTLAAKLRGNWNYYGVIGNFQSMGEYYELTKKLFYKWFNRRSQKASYTWPALQEVLERYHTPRPKIVETGRLGVAGRKSVFGKVRAQCRPGAAALAYHKILKHLNMNPSHVQKKFLGVIRKHEGRQEPHMRLRLSAL